MTSNPPAFLGKRTLLMETCSNRSCPTNMGVCVRSQGFRRGNVTDKGQGTVQNNGDQFPG